MTTQPNQLATNVIETPFDPMVSVCNNVYNVTNLEQRRLSEIFAAIRDGWCGAQITVIRAVFADNVSSAEIQANLTEHLENVFSITMSPDKRDAFASARNKYLADPHSELLRVDLAGWLKTALPGVLPSGLFHRRAKTALASHSGVICIDIDDLTDAIAKRSEIGADPHCLSAIVSPSGTGVKVFLRVPLADAKRHSSKIFPAAAAYLAKKYGIMVDESASDVSRLCYLSWDPEMTINLDASVFEIPETGFMPSCNGFDSSVGCGIPLSPGEDYNARGDVAALLRKHEWSSSDEVNWTRPGKESGTSATLGIAKGPARSLWVFSSNAAPFQPEKGYEPWRVFSMLECQGDDNAASAKLHELGFGTTKGLLGADGLIILPSLDQTITASAQIIFPLIAAGRTLFSRGGVVHEVVNGETGSRLEVMLPKAFRSRLEKHGKLMVWRLDRNGRKLVPTICPEETAAALLVTTEALTLLPAIRSVVASPVLALDGQNLIVLKHGWNQQNGGVFVSGGLPPDEVPIDEAVNAICDLLVDFDFQTDSDCSRALAALVTPALKAGGLLTGNTPIQVCEADKSQSGKGFFLKVLAAVYAETPSLIAQKDGGVGSLDETVASALIAGRPFIQLDNMRGKLSSTQLEAIITANGPFACRAPHRGTVEVDTRPFTFSMTSNGVATTRDLANRCSIIRIRKRPEDHVFQAYPEGGLHDHIEANQPYYLGCVFAVVREWVAQGQKRTTENRHDFRDWAQTLDWIVTSVFGACPLMDGHNEARDRVSDQNRTWLRAIALQISEQGRLGETMLAVDLVEISEEGDVAIPNCRDDVQVIDKARAIGKVMKKIFTTNQVAFVDGWQVTRAHVYSAKQEKPAWHYNFTQN